MVLSVRLGFAILLVSISVLRAQPSRPDAALDEAVTAFEQGNTQAAQKKLDESLTAHPNDLRALILQGVVLDSQQRYSDAEPYYQRALKIAPSVPQLLNNVANHYLASGDRVRARGYYEKAVVVEPAQANANLQLAQMCLEEKRARQALEYLNHLGSPARDEPNTLLLRARALSLTGQCSQATGIAGKLEDKASGDPRLYFSIGMTYAECKAYDQAEKSFSLSSRANPGDFDNLYNLGWAALRAGHPDRAASVLEVALRERPEEPDCLYALSQAYLKLERPLNAAALLAKAEKLAPVRADVVLLLAQVSAQLGFYEDSSAAYSLYLTLKPADDVARRERGFALACAGQTKSALLDLEWYARRHPNDPVGFYELAKAQTYEGRSKALQSLDRALTLDPKLTEARYSRAVLNIEQATPSAALDDLRLVLESQPNDYRVLVRLGQAYMALNRLYDAEEVLKKAVDLAPNATLALIQYSRAVEKLGRKAEAASVLSRLNQPAMVRDRPKAQSGLIEYLSLPPADQRARYLANLRKSSSSDSNDLRLKLILGSELLSDGQIAEGLVVLRELQSAATEASMLAEGGRILIEFEQYDLARQFLEKALTGAPTLSGARLDLAIALFQLQHRDLALVELDRTPTADRQGDYYLLRAQILDSLGKSEEAVDSLNHGIRAAPTKTTLYFQAVGFLLKHKMYSEALSLLEQATRILPDSRELLLAQAVTLIHLKRTAEAQRLLSALEGRWPEWDRPYLLSGVLFELESQSEEARQALETAIALGANTPEAYYYQALAITHSAPDDLDGAQKAINRALDLTSTDPRVYVLAGKIALASKQNELGITRLLEATRLQPKFIPAHYALVAAYRNLGDREKSDAEAEEIKRITRDKSASDEGAFSMADFLFSVRPTGSGVEPR